MRNSERLLSLIFLLDIPSVLMLNGDCKEFGLHFDKP